MANTGYIYSMHIPVTSISKRTYILSMGDVGGFRLQYLVKLCNICYPFNISQKKVDQAKWEPTTDNKWRNFGTTYKHSIYVSFLFKGIFTTSGFNKTRVVFSWNFKRLFSFFSNDLKRLKTAEKVIFWYMSFVQKWVTLVEDHPDLDCPCVLFYLCESK